MIFLIFKIRSVIIVRLVVVPLFIFLFVMVNLNHCSKYSESGILAGYVFVFLTKSKVQ